MISPFEQAGYTLKETAFRDLDIYRQENILLIALHKFKDDKKQHRISGNHLDERMFNELNLILTEAAVDSSLGGVILTSAHRVAFSRGAKIELLLEIDEKACRDFIERAQALVIQIQNFPKPVCAALNGLTLGGGLETAMACDYRLSSTRENVMMGLPEVTLGIIPAMGGTQNLRKLIGEDKARDIIQRGFAEIGPKDALDLGLVDALCEPPDLLREAFNRLRTDWKRKKNPPVRSEAFEKDPEALAALFHDSFRPPRNPLEGGPAPMAREAVDFLYRHTDMGDYPFGLAMEKALFLLLFRTEDCREGIGALREERLPLFSGT